MAGSSIENESLKVLGPNPEVMKFFSDYMLRGVKNLDEKEREVYRHYMKLLTMERYIVDPNRINMNDLVNAHKPGAIIRCKDGY